MLTITGERFRLYSRGMRVERVRYFLAAVETGSLRSAAARCGVSQPTIGQQIGLLEEELDVVLMTRSRRGVQPTAAGQAMVAAFRELVAAEESVREAAMAAGGAYAGGVHIGGVSVTAETIIAPVVGHLREHRPGLRFTVREGASADIEAAVLAGELDFGVITMPLRSASAGLERIPLIAAPVGVLAPAGHPLAGRAEVGWSDLRDWPIVTMRAGTVLWDVLHRHVPAPDVVVQAMSARTLKVMVARGAGLGLLAGFGTSADIPDVAWIPVTDASPLRLCLVQRADSQPSRAALIVRQLIRARAEELKAGVEASAW